MRANPPPLPPPIGNLGPGADVVVGVEREGVGVLLCEHGVTLCYWCFRTLS